ncbi:hypothetical protein J7M22_14020 [Candidatus Poribacteria bacterium]|nr:hypothetical protein [Candidatus Poribacteria bacterium]
MKLPNHGEARIPKGKVTGYLLSTTHRDGHHKAAFFMNYGFSAEEWEMLVNALLRHAAENEVVKTERTPFGTRYVVDGPLSTPSGRSVNVRVVWFIEHNETIPRLVTAYPLK